MEYKNVKTAIIGGGAAGLACAVQCASKLGYGSTLIIERQARTGRKLLATGNGRCNLSNRHLSSEHYYGDKAIIRSVLSGFGSEDVEKFFGSMGLLFRDDSEGRVYPYSNQASTVLDCMRLKCEKLGVEELCDFKIKTIRKSGGFFLIESETFSVKAQYVVFATGSRASSLLGANDSGYRMLEKFGIRSTPLFPALSPVSAKEKYKNLKGVRAKGSVTLTADKETIKKRFGEIQFTDNGLSGICVFEISRFVNEFFMLGKISGKPYQKISISVDVMSDFSYQELCAYLFRCKRIFSDGKASDLLSAALNRKLAQSVAQYCSLASKKCTALSDNDIKKLAYAAKNFVFTPVVTDSYQSAQVSAGGISSQYVNPETLMSKSIENLFIIGELLDVDGDCGGYNLHFAFGSAAVPVKSMK